MKKNILSVSLLDDSTIEIQIDKNNEIVAAVLRTAALSSFNSGDPILFTHMIACVENVLASLRPEITEDYINTLTKNLAKRKKQKSTKEKEINIPIELPKTKS